jgi:uncharacterized protein with HEPN domain
MWLLILGSSVLFRSSLIMAQTIKKVCQDFTTKYPHITWQTCAAHTTNLMLKDIGRFPDVAEVVDSAKRICRFFYNHNR